MMNIINETDSTTNDLLEVISSFTKEQFNKIPFEGSWTAGQVAEHLFKSESGIPRILSGTSRSTERPPDEKVALLQSIFMDFNAKFQSPEFILPSDDEKDPEAFLSAFSDNRSTIREQLLKADLTKTCTSAAFPQVGELTGLEWASFMIFHSKRHTRQMRNIYTVLTNS